MVKYPLYSSNIILQELKKKKDREIVTTVRKMNIFVYKRIFICVVGISLCNNYANRTCLTIDNLTNFKNFYFKNKQEVSKEEET